MPISDWSSVVWSSDLLAVAHHLLDVPCPVGAVVVRDALRGLRRRAGVRQRQAGPLRLGEGIGREAVRGFTLSVLLEACGRDVAGLRDAAILSLGYDAGLDRKSTRLNSSH